MTTVAVMQARMTSTRFPGKVLADLHGAPMLSRQLERVLRAQSLDAVVVATSTDPSDDPLVEIARSSGASVVRGPLDDVLARFIVAIDEYKPSTVVRLTADCPLAEPAVIDLVVSRFLASGADYVSNTMTPTYPDGLDVEVVKASVLREVAAVSTDAAEREHVTLGVYRRHDQFRIENVANAVDFSRLRWTVDTPDDLEFVRCIYGELYPENPGFDMNDILELLSEQPELNRTIDDAPRNAALHGLDTGAMNA